MYIYIYVHVYMYYIHIIVVASIDTMIYHSYIAMNLPRFFLDFASRSLVFKHQSIYDTVAMFV